MAKHKVLVTGVAGFIGSSLAERLIKEGHEVVGIDNLSYGLLRQVPEGVKFHEADIRGKDIYPFFKGVDAVFHLAAKNCLPDCQKDPVETLDVNVTGTANVFEAVRQAHRGAAAQKNQTKVIYAESSAIEEGEKRLKGFYAISKMADGRVAEGYRDAYGLNLIGLRYFNVYGPRQDYRRTSPPIISKFIIKMLKGEPPLLFEDDDRNKRDFVYVDDVNDFHMICLEDERVDNRMFRIASGKSTSIREIYETIKKILGSDVEAIIKKRPENPDFEAVEPVADISDAKKLGWKPKISLEDGLRAQVEYLKKEFAEGRVK